MKKFIPWVVGAVVFTLAGCGSEMGPEVKKEAPKAVERSSSTPKKEEPIPKPAGDPKAEKAAEASAQAWLKILDSGNYGEAWTACAQYLRSAVPQKKFAEGVRAVRKPLGKVISRTLKSKKYLTTIPAAPDGRYVIIQYDTAFENKKAAVETITPMQEPDGTWRVSGYYIK